MQELYAIRPAAIYAALRKSPGAFILINLYLLEEYVRPQSIYAPLEGIPIAKIILGLTLIFFVLLKPRPPVRSSIDSILLSFFLVILLSSVAAYYPDVAFAHLWDFISWLIIYYLITRIVTDESRFFIFLLAFLIYNFKMSQHGAISWALRGFSFASWGVTGAPGWFHNSGEFGIEMCIFIPLSIYFIFTLWQYWGKFNRLLFLLFPITAFASVIASSSRGAFIGTAAALIVMVAHSRHRVKAFIAVALTMLTLYLLIPPESLQRFQSSGDDRTSIERLTRWKDGVDMMQKNPLLGIGYRNWPVYYGSHYPTNIGGSGLQHNIFLDVGTELGYTGLAVFLLMIGACFANNSRTRKIAKQIEDPFIYSTALGLDAALVGLLVSGSFVSVLYYPYFWINLAFVVSLHTVAERRLQEMKRRAAENDEAAAKISLASRAPNT